MLAPTIPLYNDVRHYGCKINRVNYEKSRKNILTKWLSGLKFRFLYINIISISPVCM